MPIPRPPSAASPRGLTATPMIAYISRNVPSASAIRPSQTEPLLQHLAVDRRRAVVDGVADVVEQQQHDERAEDPADAWQMT